MRIVLTGPPSVSDEELQDAVASSGLPQVTQVFGGGVAGRYAQLVRAYYKPASRVVEAPGVDVVVALLDEREPHGADVVIREAHSLRAWVHVHLVGRFGELPRDGALWPTDALDARDERLGYLLEERDERGRTGWHAGRLTPAARRRIGSLATDHVRAAWRRSVQGAIEQDGRG